MVIPSVDGFAADTSVMTLNRFKYPLATCSARAIIADTKILAPLPAG